jgi:Ca2+-binding EF-hand superfamily protein
MHVRIIDMSRFLIPGLSGAALAVALLIGSATPHGAFAQATTSGSTATPAKPASVLDRIRKKIRESKRPKDRAQKWFETLDLDKNEEITKQELFQTIRRRFENMDRSRDKFVSKSEYLGLRKDRQSGERRFGALDSNADGRLSMAEFASPADWRFDRIDRNLDGKVSRSEAARVFDRPVGEALQEEAGECFYIERQVVRVKEDVAETFRKRGYPKADCAWTPDVADEAKAKKFTK